MRICNTLILFSFIHLFSFAQTNATALNLQLQQTSNVAEKLDLQLDYAYQNKANNFHESFDSILSYMHQAELLENEAVLAKAHCYYGSMLIMTDSTEKAIEYLHQSLVYYYHSDNSEQLGRVYNNLSISYNTRLNYSLALKYQKLCLDTRIKAGLSIKSNYVNMGAILYDLKSYEEALEYFKLAEQYYNAPSERIALTKVYTNLSICYNELANKTEAIAYGFKAIDLATQLNAPGLNVLCHSNMGSIYLSHEEYQNALYYYEMALFEAQENDDYYNQSICHNNNATIYVSMDSLQLANFHLDTAHSIVVANDYVEEELKNLQIRTKLLESQHQFSAAAKSYEKYITRADSVRQVNSDQPFYELITSSQAPIQQVEQTAELKTPKSLWSLVVLFVIEIFLILLFLGSRLGSFIRSQQIIDFVDIMLSYATVGCFVAVIGFWFYPKLYMAQGQFILLGIVFSSLLTFIMVWRKTSKVYG
jgi:tetratricopeptide (TPR) repeat protein